MKPQLLIHCLVLVLFVTGCGSSDKKTVSSPIKRPDYALVIHGGAGAIEQDKMTKEMDSLYRATLNQALDAGELILQSGGQLLMPLNLQLSYLKILLYLMPEKEPFLLMKAQMNLMPP